MYELRQVQYALVGSTVRPYLSWMKESRRLEAVFQDCRLLWKTSEECEEIKC